MSCFGLRVLSFRRWGNGRDAAIRRNSVAREAIQLRKVSGLLSMSDLLWAALFPVRVTELHMSPLL